MLKVCQCFSGSSHSILYSALFSVGYSLENHWLMFNRAKNKRTHKRCETFTLYRKLYVEKRNVFILKLVCRSVFICLSCACYMPAYSLPPTISLSHTHKLFLYLPSFSRHFLSHYSLLLPKGTHTHIRFELIFLSYAVHSLLGASFSLSSLLKTNSVHHIMHSNYRLTPDFSHTFTLLPNLSP